jgi:hypothetical protein
MNKIAEIFTAWGISFNPNDAQSELASQRIEVCNRCEFKQTNALVNTCSLCGCALKAKVFTPVKGACPAGKWDVIDNANNLKIDERKKVRFVCAQPAITYYTWQVEVMINNFIEMGINPNMIDIVCWAENGIIPKEWDTLSKHYSSVRFFFYDDTRVTKYYTSSIRPNILKQHFKLHPYLENEAIFYHDCDIVFTRKINWNKFLLDDNWYGSDTRWYIGHDYILSKGDDVLTKMCEIVDIDKEIVKENELNAIGAQYFMKDIDWTFWDRVERDCEELYRQITQLNGEKKRKEPTHHELQIWCADMWAVLWNGWKMGKKTMCHKDLEFSWATSNKADWDKMSIFHNAGVTGASTGLFYKAKYIDRVPYNDNLQIKEGTASLEYWKIIQKVKNKSCLI